MIILLDAMYNIGKFYYEKENLTEIDVFIDDKKIGAVVLIEFLENNGSYNYSKVFQEEYDVSNKIKYLYKKGSSRGTNITPSSLLGKTLKTTFNIKLLKWFTNNKDENNLFKKLNDAVEESKDKIFQDLDNFIKDLNPNNENILISIIINKNNQYYYLNDFDEFKDILIKESIRKYHGPSNIKGDGVCCLCNQNKEVYGLVSSSIGFSFSTPEKVGNVPETNLKNQWKLLPICKDCALYLSAGKKFIEKYLNFSEFGLTYYVIPNFLFDSSKAFDVFYNNLKLFESEDNLDSSDLYNIEYNLAKLVKIIDDVAEFKFLFYHSSNNAFDILAYVESVIPSWLNNIFEMQYKISHYDFFSEENIKSLFGDSHQGNFIDLINKNEKHYKCSQDNWYKKFLRDFIYSFSRKMYIDSVANVINKRKLDYNFLMSQIMNTIRKSWRNENNYELKINVIKSLMLLLLLNDLKLINEVKIMDLDNEEFSIEKILNSPSKKATFLLGVLTRKLMNIQYRELGSTPFYNKLWGLSLDQKKIRKLFVMVVNKLEEYGAGYMIKLENEISDNLAKSEGNWNLNRDDTSYYFVLGYTSPNYNKNKKEDDVNE